MLSKTAEMHMSESAVLQKLDSLAATVARLEERIADLEDLRDLETAVAENSGKPLTPWEVAKKQLDLD